MNKCPRCNLPQNGIYKCQYCGFDLKKYNKKPTIIIRKKFKDIIGGFKKGHIVSSNNKSKIHSMKNAEKAKKITEDGLGRRSGTDRRKQKNTINFAERRSGMDRRN